MFILEGNIGAGKSTLLELIRKNLTHLTIVQEPVVNWQQDVHGQSLLENFYKDPRRWAYTFETFVMVNRINHYKKEQEKPGAYFSVMERSIFSGHYCFAKNDYLSGFMTDLEWHIYNKVFHFLTLEGNWAPNGFIYLKTEPEISFERTKIRNRNAESTIQFDYIKQVHDRHEEFLKKKIGLMSVLKNVPVLELDGNLDFKNNNKILQDFMDKIEIFIKSPTTFYKESYQDRVHHNCL